MLILVEGPDCSGKSTFVKALYEAVARRVGVKVEVLHRGPPTRHPLDEYEVPLVSYRASSDHTIICDRWHLGEFVYPRVFDRKTELTSAVLTHIELFLRSRGALLVLIDAPTEQLQRCVVERGDDLVDVGRVALIRQWYLRAAQVTTVPMIHLTSEDVRSAEVVYDVIGEAENQERSAAPLRDYVTYVGPRWPQRLLLGDVRHNVQEGDERPAFMPYNATSGLYLLESLRLDARHVGVANACDVDDARALRAILGNPTTVALGRNAEAATRMYHDVAVPHPQFVRRFYHHESDAYRSALLGDRPWRP